MASTWDTTFCNRAVAAKRLAERRKAWVSSGKLHDVNQTARAPGAPTTELTLPLGERARALLGHGFEKE